MTPEVGLRADKGVCSYSAFWRIALGICLLVLPYCCLGQALSEVDTFLGQETAVAFMPETEMLLPHTTLGGVVMAVVFSGALVAILAWLLAVPKQVPATAARARRIVSSIKCIVVPVSLPGRWERAVELACRLGQDQEAEIVLAYCIEVPFTLSLGTTMARAQKMADETLDRAREIVEHHGLPVQTRLERARQAGEGIARVAREVGADLIVVAAARMAGRTLGLTGRTIEVLLNRAPCEVIIDAVPEHTIEEPVLSEAETGSSSGDRAQ